MPTPPFCPYRFFGSEGPVQLNAAAPAHGCEGPGGRPRPVVRSARRSRKDSRKPAAASRSASALSLDNRPVQFSDRLREPIAMQDAVRWNVAGSTEACLFLWRSKNAPWTPTVAAPHAGRQSAIASSYLTATNTRRRGFRAIKPMTLTNAKARKLHCEIRM
jgi:hypothetical protein